MDVGEDEFRNYIDKIPFGGNYLIERKILASLGEERRKQITSEIEQKREQKKFTKPPEVEHIPKPAEEPKQEPKYEPVREKTGKKERVSDLPVETSPAQTEEKGTSRHQYLQSLIKRMAEEKGYKATVEESIPDGRVDVGLLKNGKKIACEISVTNAPDNELGNIEKCLKAGYDKVLMCAQDKKHLEKIRTLVMEKLTDSALEKVMFVEPEELFFYLEEEAAKDSGKEQRVKGYKVKVNYQPLNQDDKKRKREAVAQVILGAFKRLKGKD